MLRRSLVLLGGVTLGFGTFAGLGGLAGAAPTTQTFSFTGAPETFTVPADVCQLQVTADGAAGGGVANLVGGVGGEAQATIAVTPGEALQVRVGGQGATTSLGSPGPGAGGFNGGGDGGAGTGSAVGGGGGGASDVRRGDFSDANRLVVGGGGAAGNQFGADGGAGGGTEGNAGSSVAADGGGTAGTRSDRALAGRLSEQMSTAAPVWARQGAMAQRPWMSAPAAGAARAAASSAVGVARPGTAAQAAVAAAPASLRTEPA